MGGYAEKEVIVMARETKTTMSSDGPKATPQSAPQWKKYPAAVGAACKRYASLVGTTCRRWCGKIGAKRASLAGGAVALAVVAIVVTMKLTGPRQAGASAGSPTTNSAGGSLGAEQFYELRIYSAAPGKLDALHARFRDHTMRLFEKHGIRNVAYWTAVDDKHQGRLYCVVAYADRKTRERIITSGISKDQEYLKTIADSEKDGKLTTGIESVLMVPTDYSPMK